MRAATKHRPLNPPQQARSRATLERLLASTQELLAEKRFEEATVAEIVRRARSSVGSFYARFPDKEALFAVFDRDLFERGRAQWDAFLDPRRWENRRAAEIVAEVARLLVWKNRAFQPLLTALALYARSSPDPRFLQGSRRLNEHVVEKLSALLLARRREIAHPKPRRGIEVGLLMIAAAAREAILFGDTLLSGAGADDGDLASELARAYRAYLGIREPRAKALKERLTKRGRRILSR
jgi:AcrR family transcriptional regulator